MRKTCIKDCFIGGKLYKRGMAAAEVDIKDCPFFEDPSKAKKIIDEAEAADKASLDPKAPRKKVSNPPKEKKDFFGKK